MSNTNIQVIDRAFRIIECLSEQKDGLGITEISRSVSLSKSTVFRIINTLLNLGYISKNVENDKYSLTLKFLQLSSMLINQTELKVVSYSYLRLLAEQTLQTVHLSIRKDDKAVYLDKIDAYSRNIQMFSDIGSFSSLYSSAVGKILLAWESEEDVKKILKNTDFTPKTKNTITNIDDYLKELRLTNSRGYSIDNIENEEGIRCVSAPVLNFTGKVIAAISVSGHFESIEDSNFQQATELVVKTANLISRDLGFIKNSTQN